MAYINLLKGNFTQRLGTFYGAKQKTGVVLKCIPFSKAPPTKTQTESVRAFEALNRVSAIIAKEMWPYLGLKQGNMHKHNRVASWLASCVTGHIFSPFRMQDVIPSDGTATITSFTLYHLNDYGNVTGTVSPPDPSLSGGKTLVLVFDNFGHSYFHKAIDGLSFNFNFYCVFFPTTHYYAVVFRSDKTEKGFNVHGFDINEIYLT